MTPMDFLNVLTDDLGSVPGRNRREQPRRLAPDREQGSHEIPHGRAQGPGPSLPRQPDQPQKPCLCHGEGVRPQSDQRDVFLDNDSTNAESIRKQLEELTRIAREHGRAVGIGHPSPGNDQRAAPVAGDGLEAGNHDRAGLKTNAVAVDILLPERRSETPEFSPY